MRDIQDIFYNQLPEIEKSNLPLHVKRTANDIAMCRTNAMHGHVFECPEKHFAVVVRNSCNNRNCPTCQTHHRISWTDRTKKLVVPTSHYHIIMKLPSFVNLYFLKNYKKFVEILYESGKKTILNILKYSQYELTSPGIIMNIHTYGEENQLHPHLHIVMTNGGLSTDGQKWIEYDKNLFSVDNFTSIYNAILRREISRFSKSNPLLGTDLVSKNTPKEVPYISSKYPAADSIIEYLGKTIKGNSIHNKDIIAINKNIVKYKTKSKKESNLHTDEFIRRYLLHVMPSNLKSVRYSGIYASNRRDKLAQVKSIFGHQEPIEPEIDEDMESVDIIPYKFCPICKKKMEMIEKILPFSLPNYIVRKFENKDPPCKDLFTRIAA